MTSVPQKGVFRFPRSRLRRGPGAALTPEALGPLSTVVVPIPPPPWKRVLDLGDGADGFTRPPRPPASQRAQLGPSLGGPGGRGSCVGCILIASQGDSFQLAGGACAFVVGEMHSANEAPFQRYKLDTAIPFMKILIKLETAAPGFFPLLYSLRLSLLFISISRTAASVAEQGPASRARAAPNWEAGTAGADPWGPLGLGHCLSRNQGTEGTAFLHGGDLVPMLVTTQASSSPSST